MYILTLLALLPWWLLPTRKTSLERGSIIRNFLSLQVVARREPVLRIENKFFFFPFSFDVDLPLQWHGVNCIWVTLNCIDRLAFGYVPYENTVIETSTKQNIFGGGMPLEECNSSSAMHHQDYELLWHSQLMNFNWCLCDEKKKGTDWCQGYSIHLACMPLSLIVL